MTFEALCARSGPLASGGSASPAWCFDPESIDGLLAPGDDAARPAEKEVSLPPLSAPAMEPLDPTLPDGGRVERPRLPDSAATDDDTSSVAFPEDVEIPGTRPPEPAVVDLIGGRVSLSVIEGSIVLNAATPRAGFVADLQFERGDELTVTFWNGANLSVLVARITDDQELTLESTETGP